MAIDACAFIRNEYIGDGVTRQYSFTFEYGLQDEVHVSLRDPETKYFIPIDRTEWTFVNPTTIEFAQAPAAQTTRLGDPITNIRVFRATDISEMIASFYPGSSIRAQDLNANFEQLRLALLESICSVPQPILDFIEANYWDKNADTIYSTDVWEADDLHVATTGALQKKIDNIDIDVGVSQITAGDNIAINPSSGTGNVTISSIRNGNANITVSDTPPASKVVGDLWWDSSSDSGRLFIWYADDNSSQWVEASPASGGGDSGGGDTLWKSDGDDLSPIDDDDSIVIGGGDIRLDADGSAEFAGTVTWGPYNSSSDTYGARITVGSTYAALNSQASTSAAATTGLFNGRYGTELTSQIKADGSASFAGNFIVGDFNLTNANTSGARITASGALMLQRDSGAINSPRFKIVRGTNDETVIINSDGSAEFSGRVEVTNSDINTSCLKASHSGGGNSEAIEVLDGTNKTARIRANGSATFASEIICGDESTTYGYSRIRPNYVLGQQLICLGPNDDSLIFSGRKGGTENIKMTADGSATFAGQVTVESNDSSSLGGAFVAKQSGAGGRTFRGLNTGGTTTFFAAEDGTGYFAGTVTSANSFAIQLEADDDTKYETTTEEYEDTIKVPVIGGVGTADLVEGETERFEEKTITRTREIKTYVGPTLDVKETLLSLQSAVSRIEALEAELKALKEATTYDN